MATEKGWDLVRDEAEELLRDGWTTHAVGEALHKAAGISLNTAARRAHHLLVELETRAEEDRLREEVAAKDKLIDALLTVLGGLFNRGQDSVEGGEEDENVHERR